MPGCDAAERQITEFRAELAEEGPVAPPGIPAPGRVVGGELRHEIRKGRALVGLARLQGRVVAPLQQLIELLGLVHGDFEIRYL